MGEGEGGVGEGKVGEGGAGAEDAVGAGESEEKEAQPPGMLVRTFLSTERSSAVFGTHLNVTRCVNFSLALLFKCL